MAETLDRSVRGVSFCKVKKVHTAFIQRDWEVLMCAIHVWIQQQINRGLVEVRDLHKLQASARGGLHIASLTLGG